MPSKAKPAQGVDCCRNCRGHGTTCDFVQQRCDSCGGSGEFQQELTCRKCGGMGKVVTKNTKRVVQCDTRYGGCAGVGKILLPAVTCLGCRGKGSKWSAVNHKPCMACGGKGVKVAPTAWKPTRMVPVLPPDFKLERV
jgi:DnaJ-class molecular chaperone